jgi:hypothetical protein
LSWLFITAELPEMDEKNIEVKVANGNLIIKGGKSVVDVRFGSLADKPSGAEIHRCPLWSKSGQTRAQLDCPLCAKSGLMHRSKQRRYSITSSARSNIACENSRPSNFAVLRLMAS